MPRTAQAPKRTMKHAAMDPLPTAQTTGRPTKYKPEYNRLVQLWGTEGKSRAEMCSLLNISRNTINDWERQFPAFRDSLARAKEHSQAWWERTAQKSLGKRHFQAQLWRHSMAGRFKEDYAEKPSQGLADALPDFLAAITEAADRRRQKAIEAKDGAGSKPIEPLDVVLADPKKDR